MEKQGLLWVYADIQVHFRMSTLLLKVNFQYDADLYGDGTHVNLRITFEAGKQGFIAHAFRYPTLIVLLRKKYS